MIKSFDKFVGFLLVPVRGSVFHVSRAREEKRVSSCCLIRVMF